MKMSELASKVEWCEEKREYLKRLFADKTIEETNNQGERPLFIEIGGPSTHVKLSGFNRVEHTILKEALDKIMEAKHKQARKDLNEACEEFISPQ